LTRNELLALPATVDVPTAAKVLGIGRSLAYQLIRTDEWPTPILRIGKLIKIPTAALLKLVDQPWTPPLTGPETDEA
jgi:predicted DNA-binding transcriptional regulator AlpA